MSALEAAGRRQSWSKVTPEAPTREQLLPLIAAAGRVADHSSLRPWRLIELRDMDRIRLGRVISEVRRDRDPSTKPLRASLLIAVVARITPGHKVPAWEQEAVASGVAHMLSLLLDEAGWGVIWRTGDYTRSPEVAALHGLAENEELMGWLYVGGKPGKDPGRRTLIDAESVLTGLPQPGTDGGAELEAPAEAPGDEDGVVEAEQQAEKRARKHARKATKKAKKAAKKAAKRAAKNA